MDAALARRIERNIERVASALFAGAAAYSTYAALAPWIGQPILGAYCGGAAALGYVLSVRTLIAIDAGEPRHRVPVFDLRTIEPMADPKVSDELILTDTDRLPAQDSAVPANEPAMAAEELATTAGVLVLDDIVADLEPNSRVVRLFDRAAVPTPGQLKQQIDQHLAAGAARQDNADAAQALSDALSELRRSLR